MEIKTRAPFLEKQVLNHTPVSFFSIKTFSSNQTHFPYFFSFLWVRATPCSAQRLLLALPSGIMPEGLRKPNGILRRCRGRGWVFQTQMCSRHLIHSIIILALHNVLQKFYKNYMFHLL